MRIKHLRVSHVDMNFVLRVLFIFAFCFEDELLQDVVITCNNATGAHREYSRVVGDRVKTHLIFSSAECS